jgi:hypothetical protein
MEYRNKKEKKKKTNKKWSFDRKLISFQNIYIAQDIYTAKRNIYIAQDFFIFIFYFFITEVGA